MKCFLLLVLVEYFKQPMGILIRAVTSNRSALIREVSYSQPTHRGTRGNGRPSPTSCWSIDHYYVDTYGVLHGTVSFHIGRKINSRTQQLAATSPYPIHWIRIILCSLLRFLSSTLKFRSCAMVRFMNPRYFRHHLMGAFGTSFSCSVGFCNSSSILSHGKACLLDKDSRMKHIPCVPTSINVVPIDHRGNE